MCSAPLGMGAPARLAESARTYRIVNLGFPDGGPLGYGLRRRNARRKKCFAAHKARVVLTDAAVDFAATGRSAATRQPKGEGLDARDGPAGTGGTRQAHFRLELS